MKNLLCPDGNFSRIDAKIMQMIFISAGTEIACQDRSTCIQIASWMRSRNLCSKNWPLYFRGKNLHYY